ncbi:IS66 family insertion sequence element accessory protein TnpA [Nitrincola iocasae]|uniref:IS66 family insertion sequence element accessory protein TnpB n=1 Tax=Nitrincola iocasae TaxID=2614693 RepID=A0A5J6LB43_9GAMM|nr:IS66 family insertion sequence element accessory protein TnpB [Nitrincola iocasae]QEW05884.1 IS66 family insertion sequence element accessory protein TnpB [Nitrincola iocasae]QEW06893.1 IS66 family insertion sequence element accessory protein TnpB [Nitrincola iocasae]
MTNQKRQDNWQQIITQWQQSDLSGAAFCRQQSVSYHQFSYWRQKLTDDQIGESIQPTGFTRVTQVKESITASELVLTLPGGFSITGLQANNIHLLGAILRQL